MIHPTSVDSDPALGTLLANYETTLRTMERAHAVWISTPTHSPNFPEIRAALDKAMKAYDAAVDAYFRAKGWRVD